MKSHDIIVLGLGGMGSAAAYHLAARGKRVLGLEQFTSPHDRGASHGATRVIRQSYFEHPSYVPLLLRAYELWRDLEARAGQSLLHLTGGLMLGTDRSDVVTGSLRSAREYHLPHEYLEAADIRRRFPPFHVTDDAVGVFEKAGGYLLCEPSVAAHLTAAKAAGADLHFEEPVISWRADEGGGVSVETARGTYHVEQLVITPGPWAPEILAELGVPFTITRQVLCWFQSSGGVAAFAPDRFPIWIRQIDEHTSIYGFPAVDGNAGGVKVAFHERPKQEACTAETIDRTIRESDEISLRAVLRDFLPTLDGPLAKATTCLYTMTPDAHFVISAHPRYAQVQVACGFSGHGFKFCSVVGEILADLAITGSTQHDVSLFTPSRFS
jgi:sarcosine oxidase